MAKTFTLTLTEEQAEILGFALTAAKRQQLKQAAEHAAARNEAGELGCRERARRIEELRDLLDTCPAA